MSTIPSLRALVAAVAAALPLLLLSIPAAASPAGPKAAEPLRTAADGGVTFRDFARRKGSGIHYRRAESPAVLEVQKRLERLPAMNFGHVVMAPDKPRGAPGVALLDYDRDGDIDIYVSNGPGAAAALYSNQLVESGRIGFRDVAKQAGVEATAQDSTGVCFGDTDNDGDDDLLVLGRMEPNLFFENRGDGTFVEVARSGLGGGHTSHTSCSMGDIDGDGLLDVAVANSFDWSHRPAIFTVPYADSHPNQLYRNLGGNRWQDVSASSGILDVDSVKPAIDAGGTLTWAVALVDYDLDGDVDLIHADDQAALPLEQADRAHLQVFANDGKGRFESVTAEVGTDVPGAWMGLAFADFDCNGRLDLFATNFGDYGYHPLGFPYTRGQWSSRWFLGQDDGTFEDPGTGELRATPFGWSPITLDYDSDGDTDVVYLGAIGTAVYTVTNDNPGAVLQNQGCEARFRRDAEAMTTDHGRRVVEGAATADLDGNGFPDVVSVSSHDVPAEMERKPYGLDWGSPFDAGAVYVEYLEPAPGGTFIPKHLEFPDGRLVIDLNGGGNGNGAVAVRPLGTVGLVDGGRVNRSGIGAVLSFTPEGMATSMKPVMGGANYASQDSLETHFGLGRAARGMVEVLWPGGVRNRLYGVERGESVLLPEVPCGFDAAWPSEAAYRSCVTAALDDLVEARVLRRADGRRYLDSALTAYAEARAEARPSGEERRRDAGGEERGREDRGVDERGAEDRGGEPAADGAAAEPRRRFARFRLP